MKKERQMSTNHIPQNDILMSELFDGRLTTMDITEEVVSETTSPTTGCLTDGRNSLWVYANDSLVSSMTRYRLSLPRKILNSITIMFDTNIFSEYEPQYWGLDTEEEWHQLQAKLAKEDEERFTQEIIPF